MERIGPNAFAGRTGLRDVTFPSTLTEIGEYAFESCPIHLVSLPSSLKKLGEDSFDCLSRYYNPRKNPQELRIGPGGPIEADGDAVYQVDGERKPWSGPAAPGSPSIITTARTRIMMGRRS